jgi:hypothetical protein
MQSAMKRIFGNSTAKRAICAAFALLGSCAAPASSALYPASIGKEGPEMIAEEKHGAQVCERPLSPFTKILDPEAARRLMGAKGITLQ